MINEKSKLKKNTIIFAIVFIFTCIIFIPFLTNHYATDTYNIANVGYKAYAIKWSLKDGRIFMAINGILANLTNISIKAYVIITLIIAIIISTISVIVLKEIIQKYTKKLDLKMEIILTTISYITIFNFMYLECMYFVECCVIAISVLLFIISANLLVQQNRYYIIKSLILVILGIMFYQGTICMFFAFTFLFSILKNTKNIKIIILDLLKCGFIAIIGVGINIILVKIIGNIFSMKQNRLGNISNIFTNTKVILYTMPEILSDTCNLFPKNLYIAFIMIFTLCFMVYMIKDKKENKTLYRYLLLIVITILSSSVTYILTLTSFYTGRLRVSTGALLGILFIFIFVCTDIFSKKGKFKAIFMSILIAYFIVNTYNYIDLMLQHKYVNQIEKEDIAQIEKYIKEYEENTNIKITKISKVGINGKLNEAYCKGTRNKSTFTFTALRSELAADGVINFHTKRNLDTIKISNQEREEYIQNYGDNENGYICIGDTLYINVYAF